MVDVLIQKVKGKLEKKCKDKNLVMEDKYEATDEQLSERRLTRKEQKEANSRNLF